MRRVLIAAAFAAVCISVLVAARSTPGGGSYKVAATFSNTAGLIPGQNVEIAGAVVGKVDAIKLTPDHRARVEMSVQTGFAPFRANADCSVKPQSLIGEKFVECDPGSPDAKELAPVDGMPTVPLQHTHAPVDIDLVFSALRQPYVQRLSLVVNELGTGVAGRPHELQQAIKRAAPALAQSDRVLRIVNSDRAMLGRLIDRTDAVLANVAPRDGDVTRFVDRASRVASDVAVRRDSLGRAIDRLPPLLARLEPSARSLAGVAHDALPVVHQLRVATPQLRALFGDLAPLTAAGQPALTALRSVSDRGLRAVAVTRPVAARLRSAAALIPHVADLGAAVTDSMRKAGAVEGLQTFVWLAAAASARFDATSHIVPSYQVTGLCQTYATKPVAGCSSHWAGSKATAASTSSARRVKQRRVHRVRRHRHHKKPAADAQPKGTTPSTPATPAVPALPQLPQLPPVHVPPLPGQDRGAQKLLDFLMGR